MLGDLDRLGSSLNALNAIDIQTIGINPENLQTYQAAIKGLSAEQAVFALHTKGATEAQIQEIMTTQTAALATGTYTQADIQAALAKNGLSTASVILTTEQQKEITNSGLLSAGKMAEMASVLGLTTAEDGSLVTKEALNTAMVRQKLESIGIVGVTQSQVIGMLNLTAAEGGAVTGTNILTASFAKLWAVISAHPIGAAIAALGALAVGTVAIVRNVKKSQEETRQQSMELTNSYKEQQASLESQINKYKELKETLDSGNLSIDQQRSIKAQLLDIQQALNESYGEEASNINLVNGGYKEQLGLLSKISKEAATDYVIENRGAFNDAKKALEKTKTYSFGTIATYGGSSPEAAKHQKLIDYIKSYSDLFDVSNSNGSEDYKSANLTLEANAVDADKILHKFAADLEVFGLKNDIDVSYILTNVSRQINKIWTDELTEYKTIYDEFIKAEVVRSDTLRPLYQKSIQAVEDYNEALSSGEGVEKARANLEKVQKSVQNATEELEGSQIVFDGIYDSINKDAETSYNLTKKFEKDKTVQDYAEQLHGLTDYDLMAIDFDNDATEQGEEAFKELMYTLELTRDQADNLIDKLVELGYVQGEEVHNILSFTEAWTALDNTENEKLTSFKEDLLSLQKAGQLTAETFNNTEGSDEFLSQTKLSAEEAVDEINNLLSSTDQLSAMQKGFSGLSANLSTKKQNPSAAISSDILSGMDEGLKAQTQEWNDYVTVLSNASSTFKQVQEATDQLATSYINSSNILSDLTEENKDYYISQLETMNVANAQAVVDGQLDAKRIAETLHIKALNMAKTDSVNKTYAEISAMINESEVSGLTAASLFNLIAAEKIFGNQSLNTQGKIQELERLASAFGIVTDSGYLAAKVTEKINLMTRAGKSTDYINKEISSMVSNYSSEIQEKIKEKFGSISIDPIGNPNDGSGSYESSYDSKQETTETFNFIDTLLSRLSAAFDKLKEKGANTFLSLGARAKAYAQSLERVQEQLNAQTQAKAIYEEKRNAVGLEEPWASMVRDGSINIFDISDDGLKQRIKDYQSWHEKVLECDDAMKDLQQTQTELTQARLELYISRYQTVAEKMERANDRIQNSIDQKETWGGSASTKNYKNMNKNVQVQISNTIKQNQKLKELQKTVTKNSEAWEDYQERIDSNNASLQDLTKSMAENAIAAAALAGQKAEKKNSSKDTQDEKTDAKLSTAYTFSDKNKLLGNKLSNIDTRQKNLEKSYDTSRNARIRYGKKILNANQKDISSKNKTYFTDAISAVRSGKLISTSTISHIVNAMKTATGKEYDELKKLLSYCNDYNANKNAEEENRLNLEMYALTAQADKNALRQEQLQNMLDTNQAREDRNTMSMANTVSAQNRNIDAQTRYNTKNVSSYTTTRKNTVKDRKDAGKKANFSNTKAYKTLPPKKKQLKKQLKKVISAIKSGKKISKEGLDAVKKYCQDYLNGDLTYYYNCEAYNEAVDNELTARDQETLAKAEAYAAQRQANLDKASNTVSERETQNDLYAATAANLTSAKGKNKYVSKQIKNIDKNLETYQKAYNDAASDYKAAKRKVNKTSSKDKKKQKIINEIKSKYVSKNKLIPPKYIENAYTVSNSFGLACENYNEALEAKNTAEETLALNEQTAKTEKAEKALEKMSNIEQEYSNKQSGYEQRAAKLNSAIELTEAKGYQVSTQYYNELIQNEEHMNASLTKERKKLIDSLAASVNNGSITKYSDKWYEACANINDVTNALDESTLSLVEYKNQLQQIKWDNFDYLQDHIRNVTSEINFMINELSRKDLANDDSGGLTDNGKAVAALHAVDYTAYTQQAKDYENEISKINEALANDPYNQTLLTRKQELIQSYQDSISAAQDEKDSIIDLYTQGYDALSNKLKNLISEYEKLLDAEKNAYDYQNNISDKTKEISQIRKQLEAYSGDMSEETKAKVQSLKVSLEEAEKDLKETQYDKYISDTKNMLSDLQENFEEVIQAVIDSLADNFSELIDEISSASAQTYNTITEAMTGIGYTPTEDFKTLLNSSDISTSVSSMLEEIKTFHTDMTNDADKKATDDAAAMETQSESTQNTGSSATGTATAASSTASDYNSKNTSQNEATTKKEAAALNGTTSKKAREKIALDKTAMLYLMTHLKTSSVARSKLSDLNKVFFDNFDKKTLTTKEIKELAKILGIKYDNQKSSGTLYKKLKNLGIRGFQTGSSHIAHSQLAFLGEQTHELQFDRSQGVLREVGQGDKIFTAEMTENLWKLALKNPEHLLGNINVSPVLTAIPSFEGTGGGDVNIDVGGISMYEVNDPETFASNLSSALNNNTKIKNTLLNNTIGTLAKGYNSLSGRKF